jgi:hypothetical protein
MNKRLHGLCASQTKFSSRKLENCSRRDIGKNGALACSPLRMEAAAFIEKIIRFRSRQNRASEDLQGAQVACLLHEEQTG